MRTGSVDLLDRFVRILTRLGGCPPGETAGEAHTLRHRRRISSRPMSPYPRHRPYHRPPGRSSISSRRRRRRIMRTMLGDHQNHVRILTRLLRRLTPRKSSPRSPGCHGGTMHRIQSRFPWSPGGAARRDRLHAAAKARENQACGQGGVLLLQNSAKAFAPIDTRAPPPGERQERPTQKPVAGRSPTG